MLKRFDVIFFHMSVCSAIFTQDYSLDTPNNLITVGARDLTLTDQITHLRHRIWRKNI